MTEREKMVSGRFYKDSDPELVAARLRARQLTHAYNATGPDELDRRQALMKELLGATGERFYIEPPFRCDYGANIRLGENFYANFDCIILDVAPVTIGSNAFLAPRVGIYTAAHPIDAAARNAGLEFGKAITIGDSVWIGANVVINPGVTIGSDVVIGAGSVVTKDIPDHVVAVGNPCRVLRPITEEDRAYWQKLREAYENS